jgi:hypothetical protein
MRLSTSWNPDSLTYPCRFIATPRRSSRSTMHRSGWLTRRRRRDSPLKNRLPNWKPHSGPHMAAQRKDLWWLSWPSTTHFPSWDTPAVIT